MSCNPCNQNSGSSSSTSTSTNPVYVLADGPAGLDSLTANQQVTQLEDNSIGSVPPVPAVVFQPSNPQNSFEPSSLQPAKLLVIRFDPDQFAFKPNTDTAGDPSQLASLPFAMNGFLQMTEFSPNFNWQFVNGPAAYRMMLSKFGLQFAQLGNQANGFVVPSVSVVRTYSDLVAVASNNFRAGQPFILRTNTSNGLLPAPGILFTNIQQLLVFIYVFASSGRSFPTFDDNYLLFASPLDKLSGLCCKQLSDCIDPNRRYIFQALFVGYPNTLADKPPDGNFAGGLQYINIFDTAVKPYFYDGAVLAKYGITNINTAVLYDAAKSACPDVVIANSETTTTSTNGCLYPVGDLGGICGSCSSCSLSTDSNAFPLNVPCANLHDQLCCTSPATILSKAFPGEIFGGAGCNGLSALNSALLNSLTCLLGSTETTGCNNAFRFPIVTYFGNSPCPNVPSYTTTYPCVNEGFGCSSCPGGLVNLNTSLASGQARAALCNNGPAGLLFPGNMFVPNSNLGCRQRVVINGLNCTTCTFECDGEVPIYTTGCGTGCHCANKYSYGLCKKRRCGCGTGNRSVGACCFSECNGTNNNVVNPEVQLFDDFKSGYWTTVAPGNIQSSTILGVTLLAWNDWVDRMNVFRLKNRLDFCTVEFAVSSSTVGPVISVTDIRLTLNSNPFSETSAGLPSNYARDNAIDYVRDRYFNM